MAAIKTTIKRLKPFQACCAFHFCCRAPNTACASQQSFVGVPKLSCCSSAIGIMLLPSGCMLHMHAICFFCSSHPLAVHGQAWEPGAGHMINHSIQGYACVLLPIARLQCLIFRVPLFHISHTPPLVIYHGRNTVLCKGGNAGGRHFGSCVCRCFFMFRAFSGKGIVLYV